MLNVDKGSTHPRGKKRSLPRFGRAALDAVQIGKSKKGKRLFYAAAILFCGLVLMAQSQASSPNQSLAWMSGGIPWSPLPSSSIVFIEVTCGVLLVLSIVSFAATLRPQNAGGRLANLHNLTLALRHELGVHEAELKAALLQNPPAKPNPFVYDKYVAPYLAASPLVPPQGIDAYLALAVLPNKRVEVEIKSREFDAYDALKQYMTLSLGRSKADGTLIYLVYLGKDAAPAVSSGPLARR